MGYLYDLGFREPVVRLQAHSHPLERGGILLNWLRGTYLNCFQTRMPENIFERFLAEYTERLFPDASRRTSRVSLYPSADVHLGPGLNQCLAPSDSP